MINKRRFFAIIGASTVLLLASCASSGLASTSLDSQTETSTVTSSTSAALTSEVSTTSASSSSVSTSASSSSSFSDTSVYSSYEEPSSQWPSTPLNNVTALDFYNINDFHGAVSMDTDTGEPGINRLATYFDIKRDLNPDGMVLTASGDMWQGSADSNITRGRLVTAAMNLMSFDAMAIGNHEFDWGAAAIETNRQMADFPLLGANIFDINTNQRASFALPHTMIERQGVRIGIIGTIGEYLGSSIMPSIAAQFDFRNIATYVQQSAAELEAQGAHITILLNHNGSVDNSVLPYVDIVFNGHAHAFSEEYASGVPILQARSNGRSVAHVGLSYNYSLDQVSVIEYGVDDYIINQGLAEQPAMAALYDTYYTGEIQAIKDEVIGSASGDFSYSNVGMLAVKEMLAYGMAYGARVAIHNTGGIRAAIGSGTVTYGDVYKALPFDNDLIVLELTGSQLKTWLSRGIYAAGINKSTYIFADTGTAIVNNTVYKIITISYLSENTVSYPHDVGSEFNTYAYARDLVAAKWRTAGTLNPANY